MCERVVDGDTIKVHWRGRLESVRIVGIDAPEIRRGRQLSRQAEGAGLTEAEALELGRRATTRLRELTGEKWVRLVFAYSEGKRDPWGRLLAYVEVDGRDLGETLLREGLAWPYEKYDHPRMGR